MKRNREDQIARAAFDFGLDYPKGVKHDSIVIEECFRAGAKWADEHPFEVTDDILQDNIIEIECECGNTFKRKLPKELVWKETDANERSLRAIVRNVFVSWYSLVRRGNIPKASLIC